jgi:non-ribosomal peptide synthetase component E (peptide arylation enzyme)
MALPPNNVTRNRAQGMATMSAGSLLTQLATENPYKDVVRYEYKNRKWSLQHVDYYSEALAIGLLENGLQPGDVVLSWLPAHFSESVSTFFILWIRSVSMSSL